MISDTLEQQQPKGTSGLTYVQAVQRALDEELERDPNVVVFGQDVGARGGVFLATEGLQAKHGPHRVFDSPLSEAAIIGMAVGLCLEGFRPVAEIQFADYVFPGFDQLVSQMAKLRYRSGGQFAVPATVRMPSGGGVHGGLWHSQSPEAYFTHTPGLKVVVPSTPGDARGLLKAAIRDDDPVVVLEPKRLYRAVREDLPPDDTVIPLGRAAIRREGHDLTLVGYGAPMREVLEAASALEAHGVTAEVLDLRSLVPWDADAVLESVAKTGRVVIVNEAPLTTGFASEVAATVCEELLDQLEAPPVRVTGWDTPYPFALDEQYLVGTERVLKAAWRVLEY